MSDEINDTQHTPKCETDEETSIRNQTISNLPTKLGYPRWYCIKSTFHEFYA
jgi:hypothetical protein